MFKEAWQRGQQARREQQQEENRRRNEIWNASVRRVFFSGNWMVIWPIWFTVCFFVGAHIWLWAEGEALRAEMQSYAASPQALNAQSNAIETETRELCLAKGYSAKRCDEILGGAPQR